MCIIFLILGLFVCFLGRILFKVILFVTGVVLMMVLGLLIYGTAFSSTTASWVGWLIFGLAFLIGLGVGYLFMKLVKLGAFLVAAWGGFSLGLLLYNAFLYMTHSQVFFWVFCCACALICGILAVFLFDHVLILSTSLAGSFLFIAGIGLVAGGYQNPFTIATDIEKGIYTHISGWFYLYMAGNLVLWVLGAIV